MTHKVNNIRTELLVANQTYEEVYAKLFKEFKKLQNEQKDLPIDFTGKHEEYENHLLKAAGLKHKSIEVWRDSLASIESINYDTTFYSAQFKLFEAESFLKEHGFDKITDALREAVVNGDEDMNKLFKIKGNIDSLAKATERLVRAFESDETNCRRLLERQNKLLGIQ
jgi:hypothetical protein